MKYEVASDLQARMEDIVKSLSMDHIDILRVKCFRSKGSSTKRTIARCHTIGKLMQKAIGVEAYYAIEFLEKFEKMSKEDQDKVIIHELMHIPKTFGGGFRQHDYVCEENVEVLYKQFRVLKERWEIGEKRVPSIFRGEIESNDVEFEEDIEFPQIEVKPNLPKKDDWQSRLRGFSFFR